MLEYIIVDLLKEETEEKNEDAHEGEETVEAKTKSKVQAVKKKPASASTPSGRVAEASSLVAQPVVAHDFEMPAPPALDYFGAFERFMAL